MSITLARMDQFIYNLGLVLCASTAATLPCFLFEYSTAVEKLVTAAAKDGKQTKLVQLIEVSTSCQLFGQLQGAWDNAACFPVTVQSNKKGNSSI